jgi:hypothetical protein
MSTREHARGAFDRFTSRIGCLLALLPIGAACLLAVSEVLRIPVGLLLLTTLVIALVSDGAAPRSSTPTTRRPSHYERLKAVLESYEGNRISASERDRQLKEIERE